MSVLPWSFGVSSSGRGRPSAVGPSTTRARRRGTCGAGGLVAHRDDGGVRSAATCSRKSSACQARLSGRSGSVRIERRDGGGSRRGYACATRKRTTGAESSSSLRTAGRARRRRTGPAPRRRRWRGERQLVGECGDEPRVGHAVMHGQLDEQRAHLVGDTVVVGERDEGEHGLDGAGRVGRREQPDGRGGHAAGDVLLLDAGAAALGPADGLEVGVDERGPELLADGRAAPDRASAACSRSR